jgi:glycerol-3-phosphate acyltransferase PlsY
MMLPILFGYLAGSVPFAFLLARRAGIDVRVAGSGNVGAANVLRTTGLWRAIAVMALDVGKGAAAVGIVYSATGGGTAPAATGAAAVVGHIYPVWLRFHGGKGVAVAAGVFSILTPGATAAAAALFLLVVWTTRYVSLGSIAATLALPPAAWLIGAPVGVVVVASGTAALILFRHRTNMTRLLAGTERRMGRRVAAAAGGDR